ncbi:MAG: class I SAM-dependent methyltransferase [bacterium]|nr:class I SAM-dependent methyltransferase [bacterium]
MTTATKSKSADEVSAQKLNEKFSDRGKQISNLQSYYRLHAMVYDATRWAFLFGRKEVLRRLPPAAELLAATRGPDANAKPGDQAKAGPLRILEVGCGTGVNLAYLARKYPEAELVGVDLSGDMLGKARAKLKTFGDRVTLLEEPYQAGGNAGTNFDLVLFSYSLSMINPQWAEVLDQAKIDLRPGGMVAAVDFSDSKYLSFRHHMSRNHVMVTGHLLPGLRERFAPVLDVERGVYLGWWKYLIFHGRRA